MNSARETRIAGAIATLRDSEAGSAQRALAATTLCAAFGPRAAQCEDVAKSAPAPADEPATRMFEYGRRHDDAPVWDGTGSRTGTITYVDDERIEQYVGAQRWIAYRQTDLRSPGFVLGDQVRIGARAGAVVIEAVGDNRLPKRPAPQRPPLRSGMVVWRSLALAPDELATTACTVSQRFGAAVISSQAVICLTFSLGGSLTLTACPDRARPVTGDLLASPPEVAVRLEVTVAPDRADAALEAERALAYAAALLSTSGEAIALDDTGATISATQLYDLAVRERSRADAGCLALAAAKRTWPAPALWLSNRGGVCDELTIVFARPWRVDFAAAFIGRTLDALAEATRYTHDPIVPGEGVLYSDEDRAHDGSTSFLASLTYETVAIDVTYLDVASADEVMQAAIGERRDIAALLRGSVACAVTIAFGNRFDDVESDRFALDMRRADAFATAVGAALARRGECIAVDADGTLYGADDLLEQAVTRRGKASSWAARVAALALEE